MTIPSCTHALCVILLLLATSRVAVAADPAGALRELGIAPGAPYPASSVIVGVRIDWSTHQRGAIGSDNFMMTWADDEHQYGIWGDGGGFGGDNAKHRVLFGVARIEGPHHAFKAFNRLGHRENSEHEAKLTGKSWGMVSVGGILYAWIHPDPIGGTGGKWDWIFREARLHSSADHGATWRAADWAFTLGERLAGGNILQFGRDYAGARDEFVYHYLVDVMQPDVTTNRLQTPGKIVLLRAPKTRLMERDAYEFYAGPSNARPRWSKHLADRRAIFEDPKGIGPTAGISYNPGLKRYLLCVENSQPTAGNLGVFEAPEPWGPWSTVVYLTQSTGTWFGHNNNGPHDVPANNFFWHFPTKWMDPAGRDVSVNFTGGGRGRNNDSFNTVRVLLMPANSVGR
jgi:hypothetical protein